MLRDWTSDKRKVRRTRFLVAVTIAFASQPASADKPAAEMSHLSQVDRWIVDEQGRAILIHGGNVSLPVKGGKRWSEATPARMAQQGFNGVRLVIFLSELMPTPGQIDTVHLERIVQTVAAYKKAGVRTLIDFHQDEYSAVVGVRGMPEWAVFTDGHQRLPGVNFPMGYFTDPAVQRAFDNFWANHAIPGTGKGVQDFYVDGLAAVAARFRDEPAVLGIDVMNEPATGSRCAQPDPVKADCPALEQELLKPFYEKASRAITAAAPRMMIFVEPFMLQGAIGIPINTPIAAAAGRRGFSFHNYGPVKVTRDKVNDAALALVSTRKAAILNTEWGFNNDPAEIAGQAADFDTRLISWLAWPRGAFEAIVDPALPNQRNGNREALLRAYARPYPQATAGTPQALAFDNASGTMRYRYTTTLLNGRRPGTDLVTEIRVPEINYPHGYTVQAQGGIIVSPPNSAILRISNRARSKSVSITVTRIGSLAVLSATPSESEPSGATLATLPPIPDETLSRRSLFGHILATPGGRKLLDEQVPGLLTGISQMRGWEGMTLVKIQQLAGGALNESKLSEIDAGLAALKITPGPIHPASAAGGLSIDSITSDLLADPRARAILDREAPGLSTSPQQGIFPQTKLRDLQAVMPAILTDDVMARIAQGLATLH